MADTVEALPGEDFLPATDEQVDAYHRLLHTTPWILEASANALPTIKGERPFDVSHETRLPRHFPRLTCGSKT